MTERRTGRFFVEVIEDATDKVIKRLKVEGGKKRAIRVEDGVQINLDFEHYSTRIVDGDGKEVGYAETDR